MPKKQKFTDEEVTEIAENCQTKTRAEVAKEMGLEKKQIHNLMLRHSRNKSKKKKLPPIKITSIEASTTQESSGKAMVIITSDIAMIKKLIGEL